MLLELEIISRNMLGLIFNLLSYIFEKFLFEKSDALVGIYREQRENSSKTVTLDLREYPDDDVPLSTVTATT